jgi:hypothetical protein
MLDMIGEIQKLGGRKKPRSGQIGSKSDRALFWKYCQQTGFAMRERAKTKGIPCAIDAYAVDALLVDQQWRCAVSGVALSPPGSSQGDYHKDPFGPSIDRIVPSIGYVPGNVRVVSNIVNSAMNEWGLENLLKLMAAMKHR